MKNLNVSLIKYNIHNIISDSIIDDDIMYNTDDIYKNSIFYKSIINYI